MAALYAKHALTDPVLGRRKPVKRRACSPVAEPVCAIWLGACVCLAKCAFRQLSQQLSWAASQSGPPDFSREPASQAHSHPPPRRTVGRILPALPKHNTLHALSLHVDGVAHARPTASRSAAPGVWPLFPGPSDPAVALLAAALNRARSQVRNRDRGVSRQLQLE